MFRICTFSAVFVFCIKYGVRWVRLIPWVPSQRIDMCTKFATDKYRFPVGTPWAGKIYVFDLFLGCNAAIIEDISVFFPFIRRGGGNETVSQTMNVTFIKDTGGGSEDEVDGTPYFARFIVLTTLVVIGV